MFFRKVGRLQRVYGWTAGVHTYASRLHVPSIGHRRFDLQPYTNRSSGRGTTTVPLPSYIIYVTSSAAAPPTCNFSRPSFCSLEATAFCPPPSAADSSLAMLCRLSSREPTWGFAELIRIVTEWSSGKTGLAPCVDNAAQQVHLTTSLR